MIGVAIQTDYSILQNDKGVADFANVLSENRKIFTTPHRLCIVYESANVQHVAGM